MLAGDFPTYYTHEPTLVISNRSRTRDRFLSQPQYQLMNQHYDRTRELTSFNMVSRGCISKSIIIINEIITLK